jgi:hypothetical protein
LHTERERKGGRVMAFILPKNEIDILLSVADGELEWIEDSEWTPVPPRKRSSSQFNVDRDALWPQVVAAKNRQAERPWWQQLQNGITRRWNPYE